MDYRSGHKLGGRVLAEVASVGMDARRYVGELNGGGRGSLVIQALPLRKQAATRFPTQFPTLQDLETGIGEQEIGNPCR